MKNLIISILTAILITGMDFWEFSKPSDRPLITFAAAFVIFVMIVTLDDWMKDRRMKQFRAERFRRMVDEMQNRP